MAVARKVKVKAKIPADRPDRGMGEHPISLRLPDEMVFRLDRLASKVASDPETTTLLGGASRSSVLRLALIEGLRTLERRYGKDGK